MNDVIKQATIDRMLRELASNLADLVESGDITEKQANEWLVEKQDQWARK